MTLKVALLGSERSRARNMKAPSVFAAKISRAISSEDCSKGEIFVVPIGARRMSVASDRA